MLVLYYFLNLRVFHKAFRVLLEKYLPSGPRLYPEDVIAEQPERFFVSELIREEVFDRLREEIPYSTAVLVEEFTKRGEKTYISANIFVERESQKGIVIGAKGRSLKSIGRASRVKIEDFLQTPVYLDLWVKVRKDWRNKDSDLREFGYWR